MLVLLERGGGSGDCVGGDEPEAARIFCKTCAFEVVAGAGGFAGEADGAEFETPLILSRVCWLEEAAAEKLPAALPAPAMRQRASCSVIGVIVPAAPTVIERWE